MSGPSGSGRPERKQRNDKEEFHHRAGDHRGAGDRDVRADGGGGEPEDVGHGVSAGEQQHQLEPDMVQRSLG